MGFKSIVAKELAAFLSDLLTDTGDWEPTLIETVQMDSAKGYIDEASVSINANPPRLALAEFYLRQAEEVAQHLADSQERAEIARLVLLRSGDLAQKNSLPAQAERYYRGAIQHNPDWVEAYLSLGSFYVDQKRWEQALLAYKDAKRLAPGSESIYEQLAALHTILGDTKGAIETWDDLAKQNPASVTPFIGRAIIALDEGDTEKAVLYYEKATNLAKAPKAESLKAELTEILNEEGERRRYDREFQYAVQLYSQSLSFLRTAEALYWRGICYVRLNKYEDAITDSESLFSDPNFESSATAERKFSGFDLAETLILVGRHQEAVNVLSKILDDKSTAPELVGLAQYLMVVGLAFLGEDYTEEATELVRYLKETRSRATIGEIQWFFGLLLSHIEVSKDLDPRTRKSLVGLTHAAAIVLE